MTKLVLIILTIYVIYYTVNILYDLFFSKIASVKLPDSDPFSIHEFESEHRTKPEVVGIEDVENLQTPNSFSKINFRSSTDENTEERQDIDYWRELFESEQSIDAFNRKGSAVDNEEDRSAENLEKNDIKNSTIENDQLNSAKIENKEKWYQLMNFAETTIQLISNENGHKVYHSSAF